MFWFVIGNILLCRHQEFDFESSQSYTSFPFRAPSILHTYVNDFLLYVWVWVCLSILCVCISINSHFDYWQKPTEICHALFASHRHNHRTEYNWWNTWVGRQEAYWLGTNDVQASQSVSVYIYRWHEWKLCVSDVTNIQHAANTQKALQFLI